MSTKGPSTTSVVAIGASVVAFTAWTIAVQAGALDGLDEQTLFGGLGPNSAVAQIATAFALLTWPGVIYAILFGVGFWARQRRLLNLGTSMWLAILFGWGGHLAWKFLLGRQRPEEAYDAITAIGPAYPSGHVVAITIVGCMGVAASIVTRQSRRFQNWVRVGVVALLVLVLLDRWLLVAHWASDLVGGVLWGAVAASVSLVLARVHVLPVGHSTTGEDQRCAIIYNPTKIDDLMTFRRHVTSAAAPAVDEASWMEAPGTWSASQRRHCADACGWVATLRTSSNAMGARATRLNCTGRVTSAVIIIGASECVRSSSVADTPPSTEFSIGTNAASTSPERTASRAATTEPHGRPCVIPID
mgnify:CR=1 FL=1